MQADKTGEVDVNPSLFFERVDSWLDGFVHSLPNILVAIVIFILFYGVSWVVCRAILKVGRRSGRHNLGQILGSLAQWSIIIGGGLLAATIIVPTLRPGDLIAGLGVSSVAIGFAFKDILQNWLAGLLILLRQPFLVGDQITVDGYEGTVKEIETRATIITTYDGQRVVIPNSEIYTNSIIVHTANTVRRSQYDVGIGYSDDIDVACQAILKALTDVDGVVSDPAPEVFAWDLAASWVTLRVRWWTKTPQSDIVRARAAVIRAIKTVLDREGIDMPYETQVQLFHDQTEEHDGVRGAQREGWPAPKSGKAPKSREQRRDVDKRSSEKDASENDD